MSLSSETAHRDDHRRCGCSTKDGDILEVFVNDRAAKLGSSLRGTRRGEEEKIIDRVNPVGTSLSAIRGRAATATAAEDDRDNDAATTTTASESE